MNCRLISVCRLRAASKLPRLPAGQRTCSGSPCISSVHVITIPFPLCIRAQIMFGKGEWVVGSVQYEKKNDLSLYIIIPAVVVPMLLIIIISVYCYR